MTTSPSPARRVGGAATLGLTLVLFAAVALLALYASRDMLVTQRMAARQVRATQAFEAAEAGLDWALAMLNANRRIDGACEPTTDPAAASFRRRFLVREPAGQWLVPTGMAAACTLGGDLGWSCRCGVQESPGIPADEDAADAPSFRIEFLSANRPDLVRVRATGCTSPAGDCVPGSPRTPDAIARHQTAYALLSALPVPPVAAVTLRGRFDAEQASPRLHNPDPETGVAVHAGGPFIAPQARVIGPPGSPLSAVITDRDTALAESTPDRFFASHFGIDRRGWARLPATHRLLCASDCGTQLEAAIGAAGDIATVHVEGDLTLAGPLTLGSPDHPVLLVASGTVHIEGDVGLHGVLYGNALRWDRAGDAAFVQGGLLLNADYGGQGTPRLSRDAAVLKTLALDSGGFVRVDGAWRDF